MHAPRYTQGVTARLIPVALALCRLLPAQHAPPRLKAADYPIHGQFSGFELGAEYLVRSIPGQKGGYFTRDYLVVEVGVFPSTKDGVRISANQFALRMNAKKDLLYTDPPGAVAASLKYPDWNVRPNLSAAAGVGNGEVVLGAPPVVGRFPGDPSANSPPIAPKTPSDQDSYGVTPEENLPIDEAILNVAFPDGLADRPVRGCLFFPYPGKTKSIRSLDLIYDPGDGSSPAAIPLVKRNQK